MRKASIALVTVLSIMGCRRGKAASPEAPPPELDTMVEQQALAKVPGLGRIGDFYRGFAHDEDEGGEWMVQLEAGRCYWVSGIGDEHVDELWVAFYDAEDDKQEDEDDDDGVMMEFCPEEPGMYKLAAEVKDGRGHFSVGLYTEGAVSATPVGVPGATTPTTAPAAGGGDLGALCDAEAASVAPGATRVGAHFAGTGPTGEWDAQLEAGTCYTVVGYGDEGIQQLSVGLFDAKGAKLAQQVGDRKAVAQHCASEAGTGKVKGRIVTGSGQYKVGLYAKAATTALR